MNKSNKQNHYVKVLSIAGFDGSGGAGIQADLKVISALGCYGLTVLTGLPVQNTKGVHSIYSIPLNCIEEQLNAILDDIGADAVKIGMLHHTDVISVVSERLKADSQAKIVLDPVMASKNGQWLLTPSSVQTLKERLFPLTTVLTPNLAEASLLLGRPIRSKAQMEQAALDLLSMGPEAVVVKGGHLEEGSCDDCLCLGRSHPKIVWYTTPRIETKNTHGTGCTFSAAIASFLAKGMDIESAVRNAKDYIFCCIESGSQYQLGNGHGPVHPFHAFWK